jgi:hypothetical protein
MAVEHNWRSTWTRQFTERILRKTGFGLRSIGRGWEDMILPGFEDTRNWVDPWYPGQSKWDEKLGKIECVFLLYDKMWWKWVDVYLLWDLPNVYYLSLCPRPLPLDLHTPTAAYEWCARRLWSGMGGDALGDRVWVNSEKHLEAGIEPIWRCIRWPRPSELRDALGGRDLVNSGMPL